ncbi:MAG TPA: two-component system activity regulator YycH [Symbiobacteriaceae bacterium]|nr:two-component system activity regulator YycH [Symbiobacteriaceae bacterium]
MQRVRDYALNGLLTVLVALSIVLSYRVWFPSDTKGLWQAKEAQVQSSAPTTQSGIIPKVLRPDRIYIQKAEGQVALLPAGSLAYLQMWSDIGDVLQGLQPVNGQIPPEQEADPTDAAITVVLPIPLTLDQWAREWDWIRVGLPNFTKVDRFTIYLTKTPTVAFSGAAPGSTFRVGPLSPADEKMLRQRMAEVDESLFQKCRPLVLKDLTVSVAGGLLVPEVTEMPEGTVIVDKPDTAVEQARYFPDLSVVRHIEEKDANSYTDGQRWLRMTLSGQMEYMIAPPEGSAPDMTRSLEKTRDWVSSHGGWPQDLMLNEYVQQLGRSVLVYNVRMDADDRYPVETANGALQLELSQSRDQVTVTHYRRHPDFTPHLTRGRSPIMPAEKVLQATVAEFPSLFLFEGEVRDMYLGYLIWQPEKQYAWRLEPVWVIQVGEKRVYAPAAALSDMKAFVEGA